MKNFIIILLFIIILPAYSQISIKDDSGQTIHLSQAAQNIISLSPGITELVYAAGGGDKLSAVVSYSDYPEQAKSIPRIGSYDSLDIERILALQPDLVIAWNSGNPEHQIKQLQSLGLKVYVSEPDDFSNIPETIRKFGHLMATEKKAENSARQFEKKFDELKKQYSGYSDKAQHRKLRTFIQIWNNPLMSVNGEHLISKVIEFCGGQNVFAQSRTLTSTPSIEAILEKDPEVIIATGMADSSRQWLKRWQQWPFLSAVKNKRLYAANPDHLVRNTPRILLGIEEVCALLHN